MIKNITLGQYMPGDSAIHRIDPRVKIIALILYIISVFIINNFMGYLVLSFFVLLVYKVAQVSLLQIFRSIRPIIYIIIFTFIVHAFSTRGGDVLFSVAGTFLRVESEGLYRGFFMTARLVFLVGAASLLPLTTTPIALTDGLEYLFKPFARLGFPAHEVALMMTIALRFIPTLLQESEKIMKAQEARGMDFATGNIIQRAKKLVPLMVPLFISAFKRADELAVAMEARCYRGGENRTRMHELQTTSKDYIALCAMILLLATTIAGRWYFA